MTAIASPQTGAGAVHVNQELSQLSIMYKPSGYIAELVFPPIAVTHLSDQYAIWDKGQGFRIERSDGFGDLVPDGKESREDDFGFTQGSYTAYQYARRARVTDLELQNQDVALQLETTKVLQQQQRMLIGYETRVAQVVTNTSNNTGSTTLSGANQWNNTSFISTTNGQHSVIMQEILAGVDAIRKNTNGAVTPNTIVIPFSVAIVMQNDPGLVDLIKYTSNSIDASVLPPMIKGMKVLIPTVQSVTNVSGEANAGSDIWGKNVWIGYVNPNPGLNCLTYGITFRAQPWMVRTWREEARRSTLYEPCVVQAESLVAADCGYLLKNVIA